MGHVRRLQWGHDPTCSPLCFLCFHHSDLGRDRRARDQNLSATWRRLWRGRGVQGADQSPQGERGTHSWLPADVQLRQTFPSAGLDTGPFPFILASLYCIPASLIPLLSISLPISLPLTLFCSGVLWPYIFLSQASIPFAVIGSNQLIEVKGKKIRGRLYPWGVVEVENPEHNDFLKLRTMLVWVFKAIQFPKQYDLRKESVLQLCQKLFLIKLVVKVYKRCLKQSSTAS